MNNASNKFLIGNRFIFDPYDNSLIDQFENDELTRLGSNESRALSLLIEEPGAIITRIRLHNYVWREQGFEVDDSSLTQAISTLRKALKDSTKSPEFIKTVPKRGYQMIAPIEEFSAKLDVAEPAYKANQSNAAEPESGNLQPASMPPLQSTATIAGEFSAHSKPRARRPKSTLNLLSGIAILIACLLPILVNMSFPPKSAAFKPLLEIDGIKVLTPKNHPDISQWNSMITSCVENYLQHHKGDIRPVEIIATGGQSKQLWLNYIHNTSEPTENVTLRLLTSHEDNTQLCQ
ncbi:transcriptional regulator [uncultured Photobacterium sp.]|uniref:winged helix-turn-helix domain-containing protein n=1 Tax=uncultured Photobacterium sp. TaxID=173973 RepID=UPI00262C6CB9|nr:transcriptional regulator [uncultured Photobacterium sp.]